MSNKQRYGYPVIHGMADRQPVGVEHEEWQVLVRAALQRFVCDPDWSEYDFISRIITGHARPKNGRQD